MSESNEQKLINIVFEIAFLIKDDANLREQSDDELAEWIRKQLSFNGFITCKTRDLFGKLVKVNETSTTTLDDTVKLLSSMSPRILESNRLLENIHMTLRRIEDKR